MTQYKFPEFVKITDPMHYRGMRKVSEAVNSGCANRETLFKEYFEGAMEYWLSEQEELFENAKEKEGEVVVTKNYLGEIILVSRQDEEGQILSVIAEPGFTESQLKTLEDAKSILNVRGNKETLEKPVEKSVAKVKEVRNRSGCSLMSAKQALEKYKWDVEKAVTYLTKGEAYVR